MYTEVKYRTFDELVDSVKLDLQMYDLSGAIHSEQLIKVAARVSFMLGLKINPSRSKVIEVVNGVARLPSDFDVLNFALLCDEKTILQYPYQFPSYKTYCQGVIDGGELTSDMLNIIEAMNVLYTETLDIDPGNNVITHDLNTRDFVVQAIDTDTNAMVDVDVEISSLNSITLISEALTTLTNVKVTLISGQTYNSLYRELMELNPCNDGTVTDPCSNTSTCSEIINSDGSTSVCCTNNTTCEQYEYKLLIPLRIDKAKTVSADSFNIISSSVYTAMLKNGYLQCNFDEGDVYLNYQSLMEDDEGTLLVMSHALVDEYYEYAIKQRILENILLNGDRRVEAALQLIEMRLRAARNNALSYVNTPDFNEMKKTWELNRKAQYYNYYDMFKSQDTVTTTL